MLLEILFLLTALSLAPAILVLMTSFTRIIVVFSFLRHALSTQQLPPNQVLVGLALFLTFFVMTPVWPEVNTNALEPYLAREIPQQEALDRALQPLRQFMLRQTRAPDLAVFLKAAQLQRPHKPEEVPTRALLPAFVISELKTAFQIRSKRTGRRKRIYSCFAGNIMAFKFKLPKQTPLIGLPSRPQIGSFDSESDGPLYGVVQGKKASAPEERMAKALDKAQIQYEFRYTVGAPRGLPGWKELDFLILTHGMVYALEVDTVFTHRDKGQKDLLHDSIIRNDPDINAAGTLWPTIIHTDGDSDLASDKNATEYVKRVFNK